MIEATMFTNEADYYDALHEADSEFFAQNWLQTAFSHSQSTQQYPREQSKANTLIAAGRFVVVCRAVQYCQSTDAILGTSFRVVSDHATREEAEAACSKASEGFDEDPEIGFGVLPQPPEPVKAPASAIEFDSDEIPF